MAKASSKKKARTRKPVQKRKKNTTRVTVDFPINEHKHLKAMAALEGVTIQEYIRSHVMEKVQGTTIPDAKFKSIMKKILEEDRDVLERLAKK